MILTCPSCGTQYVVKDGAIPPQGRQVRCAACKHSWHQDPENAEELPAAAEDEQVMPSPAEPETLTADAEEPEAAGAQEPADEEESVVEATLIEPRSGPEAEQRAYEEALIGDEAANTGESAQSAQSVDVDTSDANEPAHATYAPDTTIAEAAAPTADFDAPPEAEAHADDEFSPFAERDFVGPRRRSPLATIAILVVVIAAIAAAFWFLAPAEWKTRVGLADGGKTPLELMITHPDRQKLASGQESLTVTGRVINPTGGTHAIPPIYAQLKSHTGKIIYSWTIDPPAPSLGPRASTSFNSTQVDVPPGGEDLTITLGAPKA